MISYGGTLVSTRKNELTMLEFLDVDSIDDLIDRTVPNQSGTYQKILLYHQH